MFVLFDTCGRMIFLSPFLFLSSFCHVWCRSKFWNTPFGLLPPVDYDVSWLAIYQDYKKQIPCHFYSRALIRFLLLLMFNVGRSVETLLLACSLMWIVMSADWLFTRITRNRFHVIFTVVHQFVGKLIAVNSLNQTWQGFEPFEETAYVMNSCMCLSRSAWTLCCVAGMRGGCSAWTLVV